MKIDDLRWDPGVHLVVIISYLKKVFWPNLGVGAGFQILEIRQYVCGLEPDPAYILDQNPFFEIASNIIEHYCEIITID